MPEGPEVRRYADALQTALDAKRISVLSARTKAANAWLAEHPDAFPGRRVERVRSKGKNLVGFVEGGLYFYAHLLMWGRWEVLSAPPLGRDRRERARVTVEDGTTAILLSAPIFEVGEGDPFVSHPYVSRLGPDILPYPGEGPFAASCFVERLRAAENRERAIGAVLLDQTVVAGIGNYLRAEVLFACRLSPWRLVADLSEGDIHCLGSVIPELARRAYEAGGRTVTDEENERMQQDRTLLHPNSVSTGWGSRHYVFRRTNLPCLVCGGPIRQKRQPTYQTAEGGERERITYYCPNCQEIKGSG